MVLESVFGHARPPLVPPNRPMSRLSSSDVSQSKFVRGKPLPGIAEKAGRRMSPAELLDDVLHPRGRFRWTSENHVHCHAPASTSNVQISLMVTDRHPCFYTISPNPRSMPYLRTRQSLHLTQRPPRHGMRISRRTGASKPALCIARRRRANFAHCLPRNRRRPWASENSLN